MANTDSGKDAPLPVKSRDDALSWAQQITEHLAQSAGITINAEPVDPLFSPCVGKKGESAPDDRYTLFYAVHSYVPNAQHNEVVRKVRDLLTGEGLKISAYQETPASEPNSTVIARHPGSRYVVDVSSTAGDNRMVLGITTPCLKPPTEPTTATP
ncbi:hypothetical protein ACFC6U_29115 [Kitasatospora purpeofusca]|uniref:hypothetical protein n=1 Tax=Kitasatospora purpeofusca TaxID=67352 RepID=UPI0004BEC3C6|nr:hypothetical protein [Kitasatospora purpeofusca]